MILRRGRIKRYYKRNKETEYRIAVPGVTEFVHWPPFTEGPAASQALRSALRGCPAPQWALGAQQRPCASPHLSLPSPGLLPVMRR